MAGVQSGEVTDVYFASAGSVTRWAAQWEGGRRLIKDYATEAEE